MSIPTFYYPELSGDDESVSLSSRESAHAYKSRRLRKGSTLQLINGLGMSADGEIESTEGDRLVVLVSNIMQHPEPARRCKIAVAIPKGDRQRFMIEMLTQLGVAEVIPLQCERSVTACKQSILEKWQRYAIEACKQSQNPWLPQIQSCCSLESMLHQMTSTRGAIGYADVNGGNCDKLLKQEKDITMCIGPEGGFSQSEFDVFEQTGAYAVRLGQYILRTETAAVVAATQVVSA